ncbi:DUF4262 domain-containing protein [Herbiconiux sp. A18JL235]|uniref:DUF4262 domain-containing protein n=1 Tax=Herbiconiux sp. A18JL235 TaxID=3152363 RepID=A0AB39BEC8_9MICO
MHAADSSGPGGEFLGLIEKYGWAIRHVGEGGFPAFSYTVGLTSMGHPELVMVGLPFDAAQGFLNNMGADVRDGSRFDAGSVVWDQTEPPAPIAFVEATDVSGLTAVEQVFGEVRALQAVWSDSQGRLPWDVGYRNPPEAQPLLGTRPTSLT